MDTETLHNRAMEDADKADAAMRIGSAEKYQLYITSAAELEAKAACSVPHTTQPTHAILCRSAATLYMQAGRPERAREMARKALEGDAPPDVVREMKLLLRD